MGPSMSRRSNTRRDCLARARDSISHRTIQRWDKSFVGATRFRARIGSLQYPSALVSRALAGVGQARRPEFAVKRERSSADL